MSTAKALWQKALTHHRTGPWQSWIHGPDHWARVERNALVLCQTIPEADETLARCFACLHDLARRDDGTDFDHGPRAVKLTKDWDLPLSTQQREWLNLAMAIHTTAQPPRELPITVQVCLDADRLDIGRVGGRPHRDYLFTTVAQQIADDGTVPELDALVTSGNLHLSARDEFRPTPWPS